MKDGIYEIDTYDMQDSICEGCPLITIIKGSTDKFGAPLEPDEYVCPEEFELADSLEWDGDNMCFFCRERGL